MMLCQAIPYEGSEPYVFVSYCHRDRERIYPILEQMSRDGYRVWYDNGNHGGDDWLENIEDHLEGCAAFLAFISQASSLSHNCKSEMVYALKCRKKVIPVLMDECAMPKGLRMQLSALHHLKSADFPSDQELLATIYEIEEMACCCANRPEPKPAKVAPIRPTELLDEEPPKPIRKPVDPIAKTGLVDEPEKDPPLGKKPEPKERPAEIKPEPKEPIMKEEKKKKSIFKLFSGAFGAKHTPEDVSREVRLDTIPEKEAWPARQNEPVYPPQSGSGFQPEQLWENDVTVADPFQRYSRGHGRNTSEVYSQEPVPQNRGRLDGFYQQEPNSGGYQRQIDDIYNRETKMVDREYYPPKSDDLSGRESEPYDDFPPQSEPIRQGCRQDPVREVRTEPPVEEKDPILPETLRSGSQAASRVPGDDLGDVTVFDRRKPEPDFDDDKTVFADKGDVTVLHREEDPEDGDKTQKGSFRNFALLVHPAENRVYPLRLPQTKLGRSPIKCDVAIEGNDSISKIHAMIIQINRKCFLQDMSSSNGTYMYGEKLQEERKELTEVATFQLSDETLILISGHKARQIFNLGTVDILMNEALPEACVLCGEMVLLNRSSHWPGGTLADKRIHRHGHAQVKPEKDGIYLVDETPVETNGTFLNDSRLRRGESRKIKSGDRIRVGDTTLVYSSITI